MVEFKLPTTVIYFFEDSYKQIETAHLFFFGVYAFSFKVKTNIYLLNHSMERKKYIILYSALKRRNQIRIG